MVAPNNDRENGINDEDTIFSLEEERDLIQNLCHIAEDHNIRRSIDFSNAIFFCISMLEIKYEKDFPEAVVRRKVCSLRRRYNLFRNFLQLPGVWYHENVNRVQTLAPYNTHLEEETPTERQFREHGLPYYRKLMYIFEVKEAAMLPEENGQSSEGGEAMDEDEYEQPGDGGKAVDEAEREQHAGSKEK